MYECEKNCDSFAHLNIVQKNIIFQLPPDINFPAIIIGLGKHELKIKRSFGGQNSLIRSSVSTYLSNILS